MSDEQKPLEEEKQASQQLPEQSQEPKAGPSSNPAPGADEPSAFKDDFTFNKFNADNKRGIFVVLGDRDEINQDCLSTIRKYGIEPFVIYPLTSLLDTRSIRELIAQHPKTDFAFVVMTGDDFVYPREGGKPATAKLKASQEVVFLLGYLLGKFGIQNVFTVYRPQKSFVFPTGAQNLNFVAYEKNGFWTQIFENRLKERGLLDTSL